MPAGHNQLGHIYRYTYPQDDDTGGSLPSGTIIHSNVLMRIEAVQPTMALLEQGLETIKLFRTAVSYEAKDVKENDEIVVFYPENSWYFNLHFRVVSVQHASLRPGDPRSQIIIVMRRREDAHSVQY